MAHRSRHHTAAHPAHSHSLPVRSQGRRWRPRLSALAAGLLLAGAAWAQTAAPGAEQSIDIPAQALDKALGALARQTGLRIVFSTDVTEGKQAAALKAMLAPQQALERLLTGSGLVWKALPDGGFTVAPQAAPGERETMMPVVRVKAAADDDPVTEGSGTYAGPSTTASATGLRLSIRETPQTVTVVTHQQMQDQGTTGIAGVMANAAGINAERYDSERWGFSARGFAITNYMFDGIPRLYDGIYDWGATNLDMVFYDRVEIVKGATGLLSGSGMPSAAINFVRKRPTREASGSITAQLGSWNHHRIEADLSTPLTADGTIRGRVAGAYQDRESAQDHYRQKLSALYGVVEADLAAGTSVTVGADHQHVDPRGSTWTGSPVFFSDGTRTHFSRSFNPATEWSRRIFTNQSVFAMLDHRLAADWRLKVEANHLRSRHHSTLASASGGYPDPVTGEGMYLFSGDFEGTRTQNTLHASLDGRYMLFGRRHDAAFGATWTSAKTHGPTYAGNYPALTGSIFDWDGSYPETLFERIGSYVERMDQTGLYASTRLKPSNRLAVILGMRTSRVSLRRSDVYTNGTPDVATDQAEREVTPYAGLVLELDGVHALYASYTSIFEPQSLRTLSGEFLDPLKGRAYEAGVKADYLDGQLQASAAVYRIQQDNLAEYAGYVGDHEERYRAIEGVRSQGIELQLAGRLSPDWNINASFTYSRVRDAQGGLVYGSQMMTTQPERIARLFTTHRLSGAAAGWQLGAGISWQSGFQGKVWPPAADATDYTIVRQASYVLVDLTAQYKLNPSWTISVAIQNAFDKRYLTSIGLFETAYQGEPRSARVTLSHRF